MLKQKPAQRIKRRYILFENTNREEIEKIILDYLGILGWAKAIPVFVERKKGLILAVERKSVDNVRAAFEMCDNKIKIKKVSGTLKGLENE
jgi:RNase P/RNase MRP subunit POP5